MGIIVKCPEPFRILYSLPEDTSIVVMIGGRGGMKTYEASKFAAVQATTRNKRVQIVRDEKTAIRETILNEVLLRYDTANKEGVFSGIFDRLETGLKRCATKDKGEEMVVFTKGLRASSNEKKSNLKGDSNVDIVIIEEAEDLRDETKFNTFADGVRKQGSIIVIILNTPDVGHWIIKRFFNTIPVDSAKHPDLSPKELEGYFDIEPKKLKGFVCIRTSYFQNEHLPEKTIESYQGYGIKGSSNYDLHHYLTAIMGYASTGRKGQIITKYSVITYEDFKKIEAREVIGLDFGRSSPCGIVAVKMLKEKSYAHELNYVGMGLKQLAFKLCTLGFDQNTIIIADSAGLTGEPETIGRLRRGIKDIMTQEEIERYPVAAKGFTGIRPVVKQGIMARLSILTSLDLYITQESLNLLNEVVNYVMDQDRNGNSLDQPVDDHNHIIDPWNYVIISKGRLF